MPRLLIQAATLLVLVAATFPRPAFPKGNAVTVQWLGQACFLLETPINPTEKPLGKANEPSSGSKSYRIVIDPYGPDVGYPVDSLKADLVFVSHEHFDHNNIKMVSGAKVIRGLTDGGNRWADLREEMAPGLSLRTIGVYHDSVKGKERGLNSISIFTLHGIRIVHLGDLGHLLTREEAKAVGAVDLLLLPVGGVYTINGTQAQQIAALFKPKIVIPMHFKTKYTQLPIQPVDSFLENIPWPVHKIEGNALIVNREKLPAATTVYLLKPLSGSASPRL